MQKIELDEFAGPIDLLLTLVQIEEISLDRIHLLDVVTQIMEGLEAERDLNESGDVITIISTLMELKSKLLLPGEVDIGEEIQALKDDLLAKVLVHRRLSQVLDSLENRLERRSLMHNRPAQLDKKETVVMPLESQNPYVLFSSLTDLLEQARQDNFRVDYVILPIDYYYKWLDGLVPDEGMSLRDMAGMRKDHLDFSGVLIAVLELVRQHHLDMKFDGKSVFFYPMTPPEPEEEQMIEEGLVGIKEIEKPIEGQESPV
ncbi:MAG: segregation/condensation protein A [Planctomycetes bacterium]|nr:segregation/condensation protein A [Planctomycetota bacterium]